jgi:hypothetical protein
MDNFFKEQFKIVPRSRMYRGVTMRPWAPARIPDQEDIDAFVRDACEVHVMGRARTKDLCDAYAAWRREHEPEYELTATERARFVSRMKATFVYDMRVPITKALPGEPGFYGLYLNTATDECRSVGDGRHRTL